MNWNRIDMEKRSNLKAIAPLVEDIISNYPLKVNERRNLEKMYTVEEVLPLLNDIKGILFQSIVDLFALMYFLCSTTATVCTMT